MQIYRLLNFFDYKLYSCDRGVKDRSLLRVRKKNSKFFWGGPPLVWAVALWIDYLKLFEVAGLPNILINYNELYVSVNNRLLSISLEINAVNSGRMCEKCPTGTPFNSDPIQVF